MATKARKDSRGYALKKGESQRKDGRYVFRYTTIRGEQKAVYAKELSELRKKEVKIRRAIEDGLDPDRAERITLNELFDEYISQKYSLQYLPLYAVLSSVNSLNFEVFQSSKRCQKPPGGFQCRQIVGKSGPFFYRWCRCIALLNIIF